ncbi:MAG: SLBB domain-containing protein [Bacteroidota bacterium]
MKNFPKSRIPYSLRLLATGIFAVFIVWGRCIAQESKSPSMENLLEAKKQENLSAIQSGGVALESKVNPELYFLGPSDVLSINIWLSPPVNFTLTVTPEGTLIIPTVGELMVADLTLKDAKTKIIQTIRKKYLTAEITATLVKPRPIIVTILGDVLNPGLYTMSAVDRTNKAVEEANTPRRAGSEDQLSAIINSMAQRSIMVKHKDGSEERVDIVKFLATKEDTWNPYLREGDVITVPARTSSKNVFGIYGQVNSPGRYEFVEGDSLLGAIKIAQGFTRIADTDTIELSRLSADGISITSQQVDLKKIQDGTSPDIPLQPGDRIVVKAHADLREDYRVYVSGEVVYPGTYPISKNQTHLSEIIKQAGGFTTDASLGTAELIRRTLSPDKINFERLMSLRGSISSQDSVDFTMETDLRLRKEFVTIDFKKLFLEHDSTQDVILQTEDVINVPIQHQTVYVFGQVLLPGHIPLVEGKTYEYYVQKAGGYTDRARKGDIRIIKARTQQWIEPDKTQIEDGDYVWIPREPDHPFAYWMTIGSQAASMLSVVIGIGVLIVQLTK